jgi:thiamine-phosphate pyrophosphorylase
MDHACELARLMSADRALASEHLLLALLRHDDALRNRLQTSGLDMDNLETAIAGEAREVRLPLDEQLSLAEPTEEIDAGRILDAAANRAREALRVVEDYCRFVLDDTFLTGELKGLRHGLTEALSHVPPTLLLESRQTQRDVGTRLSTQAEQQRHSFPALLQANWKRLQEALRSLEEVSKLRNPDVARALEQLRYHAYTLEKAMMLGSSAGQRLADVRLYLLVTGERCHAALDWTIQEAAAGGVQMIQLREKNLNDRDLLARARQVRRWTREAGVLFIMNDRPHIAQLVEADGVHVGQDELPVKEVRRIVGPNVLIGVSTHNLDQVQQAVLDGASYIGVGPTFPSSTKDFTDFPGLDFARAAAAATSLPAFVIGGVNADNIAMVAAAGLRRVAVSQAICQAKEPREAAAGLRRILDGR